MAQQPIDWSKYQVLEVPQNTQQASAPVDWSQYQVVEPAPMSWGDVAKGAGKNLAKSGGDYVANIAQSFIHPVDTIQGLSDIARGYLFKSGALNQDMPDREGATAKADAFGKAVADRYGGWENVKRTIANDPVGFLGDLSLPASTLAAPAKAAGLARTAGFLSNMEPVAATMSTVGRPVSGLAGKMSPENLYASALKLSNAKLTSEERGGIIKTLIDEGITVSPNGAKKMGAMIDDIDAKIQPIIDAAEAAGKTVDPMHVADAIRGVLPRYNTVNAGASQEPIFRVLNAWLDENTKTTPGGAAIPTPLSPSEAQAKKVNTYRENSGAYESMSRPSAEKDALKAGARGLKEGIEAVAPEVHPLNELLSRYIPADDWLNRALGRAQNWNPVGMGGIVGVGTGNPMTGAALELSRTPGFLSGLGLTLDRARTAQKYIGLDSPQRRAILDIIGRYGSGSE